MRVLVSDKDLPAFIVSAKAAIEAGRLEEATEFLGNQAIELKPACGQLLERIVSALVSLGSLDEAAEQIRNSLDSYPDMEIAAVSLTEALIRMSSSNNDGTAAKPSKTDRTRVEAV